jgi:hypothetical protein
VGTDVETYPMQDATLVWSVGGAFQPAGHHHPDAFITMIMLDRVGIAPDLPWATAS